MPKQLTPKQVASKQGADLAQLRHSDRSKGLGRMEFTGFFNAE